MPNFGIPNPKILTNLWSDGSCIWKESYSNSSFSVITPKNYLDFVA